MKINLKVRFKNPVFWINLAISIMLVILTYFGQSWSEITTWSKFFELLFKSIMNPVVLASVVGTVWNAINDPTTKGLSDSKRALDYETPAE